jgi:hypothetical protein
LLVKILQIHWPVAIEGLQLSLPAKAADNHVEGETVSASLNDVPFTSTHTALMAEFHSKWLHDEL